MSAERSAASTARLAALREKAARRGRRRHPEGDTYQVPGWDEVTYLLDLIDALLDDALMDKPVAAGAQSAVRRS